MLCRYWLSKMLAEVFSRDWSSFQGSRNDSPIFSIRKVHFHLPIEDSDGSSLDWSSDTSAGHRDAVAWEMMRIGRRASARSAWLPSFLFGHLAMQRSARHRFRHALSLPCWVFSSQDIMVQTAFRVSSSEERR